MSNFHIPKNYLPAIAAIAKRAGSIQSLIEAAKDFEGTLTLDKLVNHIQSKTGIKHSAIKSVIDGLMLLHSISSSEEIEGEEFYAALTEKLIEIASDEWKLEFLDSWISNKAAIIELTNRDSEFGIIYKETELSYSYQNVVQDFKIITDIRPVFDKSGKKILKNIISYVLAVGYYDGHKRSVIHLAVDTSDLSRLEGLCARAATKTAAIKSDLSKRKTEKGE